MAINTPNLVEALGVFTVDPIGTTVLLSGGAGFDPVGTYNGPGDYSIFLAEERAGKVFSGQAADDGFSLSMRETANLREIRVGASSGGGAGGAPVMWGAAELANFADTRFLYSYFLANFANNVPENIIAPATGIFRGLHVLNRTVGTTAALIDYTFMVNDIATPLILSMSSNAIRGDEAVLSAPVTEGDLIGIRAIKPLDITQGPLNIYVTSSFEAAGGGGGADVTSFSVEVMNIPVLT